MEIMSSGSQSGGDERDFKMVTYVKGIYALNDSFADLVSPEIEAKFDAWVGEGITIVMWMVRRNFPQGVD
ncbi:hypothetical protein CsatB_001706 [Cannabis sativa]